MNDPQWQRQMEIFDTACDLPADEREAYLEKACAGETELINRISELVAQADKDDSLRIVGEVAAELVAGQESAGD